MGKVIATLAILPFALVAFCFFAIIELFQLPGAIYDQLEKFESES